ncbi:DNA helicase UvrB [Enterococcus faecalis]|nr:DNA helicase UvrB [Enterococcus faecalis]MBO6380183.1 DNA helicase UvrB [Enterococcus faecalis]MBO6383850.1 DNA helicase UvrB [Enterococcus faecalis]PTN73058.1 DNA helicase UvrB [Enterococcus faecalis]PTN82633.1 DNA helicase UvrB [Enterococcus faecalis]
MCTFNNLKKVEGLMNFGYLNFGTKDAVLVIAIFIILILTVLFRWSALEFVFSSGAVGIAFFAGNMKQDKRIADRQNKKGEKK